MELTLKVQMTGQIRSLSVLCVVLLIVSCAAEPTDSLESAMASCPESRVIEVEQGVRKTGSRIERKDRVREPGVTKYPNGKEVVEWRKCSTSG